MSVVHSNSTRVRQIRCYVSSDEGLLYAYRPSVAMKRQTKVVPQLLNRALPHKVSLKTQFLRFLLRYPALSRSLHRHFSGLLTADTS